MKNGDRQKRKDQKIVNLKTKQKRQKSTKTELVRALQSRTNKGEEKSNPSKSVSADRRRRRGR